MTTENATADAGTSNPSPATADTSAGAADAATMLTTEGTTTEVPKAEETADAAKTEEKTDDKGIKGDEPVVPEKYEFTMPEGVELDAKAADEFSALAKELKLSQADAQRIADIAVQMQQKQAEAHVEQVKGWADQCKTDKEFGGDNLQQNLSVARKAIDTFGSPALKQLLNGSGLGNHPEVVRFCVKAGKAISEDSFQASGARATTPETPEKRLYPTMN